MIYWCVNDKLERKLDNGLDAEWMESGAVPDLTNVVFYHISF